ncbi:MAG TPA: helix-turn-helix transcriptional regulator [Kofleriaceae bacterium]|nr:helix-turn-helix transcriptional regulator [Kofleriaceae bacterium]
MIVARSVAEFLAHPLGHCVVGSTFVIWCAAPDLAGSIQWGTLDERCVREMLSVAEFVEHPDLASNGRVLMDCRAVERVDVDALLAFTTTARTQLPSWSARIERQVVILPGGLSGILLAGALPSLAPTHFLRFVDTLDAALHVLDHPGARAAHVAAEAAATEARRDGVLLTRVRSALATMLVGATIEQCASALNMSTRTLQRELKRLGTSFSDELRRVRLAAAEDLLFGTELKIDAIADRVGLGSASRMSALLRREHNLTPAALRARGRTRT